MKKGVLTGATGYIGSNLLKYLLYLGDWDLYIITRPESDYTNIDDIKDKIHIIEYSGNINMLIDFFKDVNPDVVFHLAAAVITSYKPEQVPVLIQSNVLFGTEILEAMKFSKTRLFVSTGSYWQNFNSSTYNPVDLYAATKEAFENILQYYVDAHHFRIISLRLFDVYGENDKRSKLLNSLKKISVNGGYLNVSPGEQLLDMVHITDVCTAYLKAYEWLYENVTLRNEIYGVYTGRRIQLKKIIEKFEVILRKKINVNFGAKPYKNREIMIPYDGYNQLPNWSPQINLEEGLRRIALF